MTIEKPPPKVSVIVGYYKREQVVERTLRSLADQSLSDIEIIVFDDASPDRTAEAIRAFVAKENDARFVTLFFQQNKGFVRGLIEAIGQARGEYIAIQGSGDVSMPFRLEKQSQILDEQLDVSVVGCHYENVVESTSVRRLRQPKAHGVTYEDLLRENVFTHGEVMFRRDLYEQVGGYREAFTFCQDYDLWLRMIKVGKFETIPECLYRRYVDFEGVSYKPEKFIEQSRFSILAKELSALSPLEQRKKLEGLTPGKLAALVPLEQVTLQRAVLKAVLRAVVWGNPVLANELIKLYVINKFVAAVLRLFVFLVETCPYAYRLIASATRTCVAKKQGGSPLW